MNPTRTSTPGRPCRCARGIGALAGLALLLTFSPAQSQTYSLQRSYLGENLLDQFGFSVAGIGDVNADGFDDFLVGANVNDQVVQSGGKIYLYLGGSDYPLTFDSTYAGTLERGYVGESVSGGGDFNGDGYPDWAVGASGGGVAGTDPGRAYVFFGGPNVDALPDLIVEGHVPLGQFGFSVCLEGDLDGDSYADLCVGAPRDSSGAVYIYRGSSTPDSTADRVLRARPNDLRFGASLALLPDDDGDLRDDLVVGSPKTTEAAAWDGAVLLYRGTANLDPTADLILRGQSAGDEFGSSVWAGADLDGDGGVDLLVGAPVANVLTQSDAGKAYFFAAGAALDSTADQVFLGLAAGDQFGSSVSGGFDWDGDGFDDIAVGAPNHDSGGLDAGRVDLFFGGPGLDSAADQSENGGGPSQHLGTSVAAAGDIRHNGRGALLIGGYNGTNNGRVLLFGSSNLATASPPISGPVAIATFDPPRPNPFNPRVELLLNVPAAAEWSVAIYDFRGRQLRVLSTSLLEAGAHRLIWNGEDDRGVDVASGVYRVVATNGRQRAATSVSLIR